MLVRNKIALDWALMRETSTEARRVRVWMVAACLTEAHSAEIQALGLSLFRRGGAAFCFAARARAADHRLIGILLFKANLSKKSDCALGSLEHIE